MKRIRYFLIVCFMIVITFSKVQAEGLDDRQGPPNIQGSPGPKQGGRMDHRRGGHKGELLKKWLKEEMPDLYQNLESLKETDPELFETFQKQMQKEKTLHYFFWKKRKGKEINSETLATFKTYLSNEFKTLTISREYKKSQSETTKAEIKAILEHSFALKEKLQIKSIERMEKKVKSIREMLAKRKELKDKIIAQRIDELTEDNEEIKW
ncbi:hypothetical protein ACFLQ1_01200 [Candidatus Auribacterota bacterium]